MDFLLPFVTSDDPAWVEQIARYCPIFDKSRYRDFGTLKYLFRGVEKFMPFIDRIVLVVSGQSQVPEWVNRDTVRVVTHDEFMPANILPTFNSSVIECFINDIPDLSERFIYANDDMFVLSPMDEGCFFKCGFPIIKYIVKNEADTPFLRMCKNTSNLAKAMALGLTYNSEEFYKPAHFFAPMLRDVNRGIIRDAWKLLPGSYSRFRKEKNYNQYLYQDYYIESGLSVNAPFAYTAKRVLLSDEKQVSEIVRDIKFQKYQMYCINDEYKGNGAQAISDAIIMAFEEILPDKSRHEK